VPAHAEDHRGTETYTLYRRGVELLEDGSFGEATVPLAEAARRAPEKSSVREALGRAYFRNRQFAEAATEFEAVVETHPVNDYAHFCLGRALSLTGHPDRARHHLALASNLRPERRDYRLYRRLAGT
jgi:Flp pilus assembly protein TadD